MGKMLSKEAERFVLELKMYLMGKGKNDDEISDVVEELEDHLLQAEADGKDIKDITGDSPREYMKSIGEEMGFDTKGFLVLAPMTALLILAFLTFPSALRGDFTLTETGVWLTLIATVFSLAIFGILFFRVLPKLFHSKLFYVLYGLAYLIVLGIFVVVEFMKDEPFFVATPMQNNLIAIGAILVFIVWAFYSKTWITIFVPFFLSWEPLATRFIPDHINEDPFYITIAWISFAVIILLAAITIFFVYRKRKQNRGSE
jgi:hypothetical protein